MLLYGETEDFTSNSIAGSLSSAVDVSINILQASRFPLCLQASRLHRRRSSRRYVLQASRICL